MAVNENKKIENKIKKNEGGDWREHKKQEGWFRPPLKKELQHKAHKKTVAVKIVSEWIIGELKSCFLYDLNIV